MVLLLTFVCLTARGQTTSNLSAIVRLEGTDPDNHVAYIRLSLDGVLIPPGASKPKLTAQCTHQPSGKLDLELFADFGGVDDRTYHRPWMPKDGGLFAPRMPKAAVTMEFLGYTHVKPVKRQWELLTIPDGELRYNPPSAGSSNMEEIVFYLQYMKALPTLELSYGGKKAQFVVTPLLDQIRKEPICVASRL